MKLKGQTFGEPEPLSVVIERGENAHVFLCKAVFNFDDFDKLCPRPKQKVSMKKGKIDDVDFKKRIEEYAIKRSLFIVLTSLSATEDLVWEKVDMTDPETWKFYENELREAGLTTGEIAYLVDQIGDINTVDEKRMDEARERFFHTKQEADTE